MGGGEGRKENRAAGPRARSNEGHIFINNVGEDNRRHPSMCRRHTWEGQEDRIRMENNFSRLG